MAEQWAQGYLHAKRVMAIFFSRMCTGLVLIGSRLSPISLHQHWFNSNGFGGANEQGLTYRSLWDVAVILKVHFSNSLYRVVACEIAPRWKPQNIIYKISLANDLVLADPSCLLLGQDKLRSLSSYGVSRPQFVNILQFGFMHFAIVMFPIIANFCFASSFVPDLEANVMVTRFTTRVKNYCWWSPLSLTFKWLLVS